jgi:hypothetical protein
VAGDLNENLPASLEKPRPKAEPTRVEAGKVFFPGNLTFDAEEFKRFRADHPEYCQPPKARASFTVTAHPAIGKDGIPSVGISLRGAPDPGPPQDLVDFLSKKDGDGE